MRDIIPAHSIILAERGGPEDGPTTTLESFQRLAQAMSDSPGLARGYEMFCQEVEHVAARQHYLGGSFGDNSVHDPMGVEWVVSIAPASISSEQSKPLSRPEEQV